MADVHQFRSVLQWEGSTAVGYENYRREHRVSCDPATTELTVTADPAFLGDPAELNPEQLLLVSAASCQLLSFLAVAARARVDVVAYRDDCLAEMPMRKGRVAVERIVLRPHITIVEGPPLTEVERLVDVAHRHCFIANSLRNEPIVEPSVNFVQSA